MTPAQVAHTMALVDELLRWKVINYSCPSDSSPKKLEEARAAVEAALRDAPQQAESTDAKDAARYRYLVVMETKAAPDTVAHYIRNPAHLDRVIEVMEQKP